MISAPAAGPGRVLALVYGFFALAAGARSGVQLVTHGSRAPVAYGLSAVAALIYLTGTILIVRTERTRRHRRQAALLCGIELAGVIVVGTVSYLVPAAFPDATVWSHFGSGYGWVPLVLPVLGLLWLRSKGLSEWGNQRPDGGVVPGHDPEDGSAARSPASDHGGASARSRGRSAGRAGGG